MPKFTEQKPAPTRERPRAEPPRAEPPGLDAFAAQAGVTPPPPLNQGSQDELAEGKAKARGRGLPSSPMPVRFPPDVKKALERLAASDERSQQQILERVAFPAILEAARRLG